MNMLDGVRALLARRTALIAELSTVDVELAELRSLLDEVSCSIPTVAQIEPRHISASEFQQVRACERCGASFSPSLGSSGRFCSGQCYAGGISIEDRRAALLAALAIRPMFAWELRKLPEYSSLSGATVTNDLYALSNKGRVHGVEHGWAIGPPETESSEDDEPDDPLAESRPVSAH